MRHHPLSLLRGQPFRGQRRPGLALLIATAGVLLGLLLGGCGDAKSSAPLHDASDAAFPPASFPDAGAGTRAQALQVLDSLDRSALLGAFEALETLGYTWHVRTEALGSDGHATTFAERVVRRLPGGGLRVLQRDSSGTFDFGALGRFADTQPGPPAADLMQQVFPDEPAFVSERNRYAFQYRLLPDTTLANGPTRVVAVRARPGPDGEKQALRQARLYLDRATGQLVAFALHRVRRSLLFDEDMRAYVRIRPASGPSGAAGWVPAETRFETRLDMPLRPAHRLRSSASYYQYRRASS